jgi:GT2 family glycosyltransferase
MDNSITVILNGYRRSSNLEEQFKAIQNQTVQPNNIFLWQNFHSETYDKFPESVKKNCITAVCNTNLGVWSRFAYALNTKTKYVCIFDDDTIPGSKWLENCLNTIQTHRGLLGTRGIIFENQHSYYHTNGIGWETANEEVIQVDIVGHCWFFEREWLAAYWGEMPPKEFFFAGEDMHFSYAIQKHYGLNTYVPPHPKNDKEMWGSLKAMEYGDGAEATCKFAIPEMFTYLNYIVGKGFKVINHIQ